MRIDFDHSMKTGQDIHVIIESYCKGTPDVIRADPFDSYEGDSAELEIFAEYPDGSEVFLNDLDWLEKQRIEEEAWKRIENFEDFNY